MFALERASSVSTLYNCQISGLEQQSLFLVSCCVTSAKIDAVGLTVEDHGAEIYDVCLFISSWFLFWFRRSCCCVHCVQA